MESAISNLYYGRPIPYEMPATDSTKYKKEQAKASELSQKLYEQLNEDQSKLLDEYLVVLSTISTLVEEQKFKDGFIMASRLMNEVYHEKN